MQADRDFQQMLVAERTLLLEGLSDKQRKALADDYFTNKQQVVDRFKKYTVLGDSPKEIEISKKFNEGLEAFEKTAADKFPLDKEGNIRKFSKAELITNSLGPVNSKFEGARDSLDQLQELILGMGDEEFKEADETYSNSIFLMSIISIVSLFGSVGICIFMARRIDGRINNIVESISNEGQNLENVSNTFKNKSVALSSISEQLSAAATETSSSLHEISQMIKSNTDGSNNVASLIQKSQELVTDGVKSLGDLGRGVKDVENSTTTLANTVEKSNSELNEIVKVFEEINVKTQVINDIVFQTKLLSFNASVEAARAGENGKGFSVVAEEVGNLAKMSGESADEISKLLVDSLKKVTDIVDVSSRDVNESLNLSRDKINKSVEISNQCQEVFTQVLRNFDEVSANSNEVANASKEQLIGVEEVSKAMQEISSSASLTSQSAHDLNTASSELSQAVNHIGEDITDLKGLIIAQIKSARHAVSNVVNFNKTKRNAETKKAA
ncbi:methyl-accepting chemotaxis protein signaling domain protein [Bacteriovorax sp. BAL6_X]|nr:methyl-accepting chemotaxis protein signaling domain protein [Bacteriovorax sp. BAL6_X]